MRHSFVRSRCADSFLRALRPGRAAGQQDTRCNLLLFPVTAASNITFQITSQKAVSFLRPSQAVVFSIQHHGEFSLMSYPLAKAVLFAVGTTTLCALQVSVADASDMHILETEPPCISARVGWVQSDLGDERPDPRRGGLVLSVSYKRAFEKLKSAAAERGADAIVLREHRADYFTKGTGRPRRPTYIALAGVGVRIKDISGECSLAHIDLAEFERAAMEKDRTDIMNNAGVSF